jgi:thioesterase domain-containing protein
VHGATFCYMNLARYLPPNLPVFGFQASGLEPGEARAPSVGAMAETYVTAIRTVQPQGPYQLLGWSFGGLVAYEMAHQLEAMGEHVSLLALLDTRRPDIGAATLTNAETIALYARQFLNWDLTEGALPDTVETLVAAARTRGLVTSDFSVEHARRLMSFIIHATRLSDLYRPSSICHDLIFFRAMVPEDGDTPSEEHFNWSEILGRDPIKIPIACKHSEMMWPDHAKSVADSLSALLSAAD